MKLKDLFERFSDPLDGWYVVRKDNDQIASVDFKTKEEAQKYLMTRMFANHHLFTVKYFGDDVNEAVKHWKDSKGKGIGLGDKVTIKFKGGEQSYTISKPGAERHTLYAVNDKTGNEIHAPAASFTLVE